MSAWVEELAALVAREAPAVLVTVAAVKGSAPREAGAAMIVTAESQSGTIGGGRLEYRAARLARTMLRRCAPAALREFPLGPELGQCCGGHVTLHFHRAAAADRAWLDPLRAWLSRGERAALVFDPKDAVSRCLAVSLRESAGGLGRDEAAALRAARATLSGASASSEGFIVLPVSPPDHVVYLFGAGHVGRALAAVLGQLPCRVVWIDEREGALPAVADRNIALVRAGDPAAEVARAPSGADFLVITHSHARDQRIVEAVLRRGDFAYLGLIGSATKRARFVARLRAAGIAEPLVARLVCPIGAEGIPGKEPGVIALAVATEIMRHRRAGAGAALARSA